MVLAVLDDLLFASKIRTTAKQLGVTIVFARSPADALASMRQHRPSLVILDLNNPRTDPLGIVQSMKLDAALAGIRTVGFASHVQADVIDAARRSGVAEVMARSAFAQKLPEILSAPR
jgi:PleD family two-component response regulator